MKSIVSRFMKDESGATAIEYGLIAAIVGLGIMVGLNTLKNGINDLFENVADTLQNPNGGTE